MKSQLFVLVVMSSFSVANISFVNASESSLRVEYPNYEVRESESAVVIAVVRNGTSNLPASVDYSTANITALAGLDYTQTVGQLAFAPGETLKLISVPILRDALKEPNETFRFTLANAIGSTVAPEKSATVTVKDASPGVGFTTAKYFVHEEELRLQVTVRRGDDLILAPCTVNFATADGSAVAGQDYRATNGTLTFAAGELSRSFEIEIVNDGILEADETFRVSLGSPTGGVTLTPVTNLVITLCDSTGSVPHGFTAVDRESDGRVKLTLAAGVSKRFQPFFDLYPIEVSTNLVDWQALALLQRTNNSTNGLTFVDNGAPESKTRFYRVPTNHFTCAYPRPNGPYSVGKVVRIMHDITRRNRYGISTNGSFALTILYPATPRPGQRPTPWFEEALARDTSSTSYWVYFDVQQWLDRVPYLSTYSFRDAPLAEVPGSLPVVLFSPGFTVDRSQDMEKLESLASNGYLVVTMDHFDALNVEWPDGFYYSSATETTQTVEDMEDRVRDLVFVLNELANWNQNDPQFAGRIALDRIGAMGMSWGGPTVAELAQRDDRCRAVVLLDPGNYGSLLAFSKPSLTMHNPEEAERLLFDASKTNAVWFQISNTDHASFADYVIFSARSLSANREAQQTIQAYTLSFFDKWLKGQDKHLHEGASPAFPRVINYRKK